MFLHTKTAALGLSVNIVKDAINDVYRTRSDIAMSQKLHDYDLASDCLNDSFSNAVGPFRKRYNVSHVNDRSNRSLSSCPRHTRRRIGAGHPRKREVD
jgi:hypothetical protein